MGERARVRGVATRLELRDQPTMMFGTRWEACSTLEDSGQAMHTLFLLQ